MKDALSWFEIPVNDLDRAARFYQAMLAVDLRRELFFGTPHAIFPYDKPGVGGALVRDDRRPVGTGGAVVYLDVTGQLDACLARVAIAGGDVVHPRTAIADAGVFALVRDTEGNTVGLHSRT